MIKTVENLQSDATHLLLQNRDYFYHSSIGNDLQRAKSIIYNGRSLKKDQTAVDLIEMADSAYKSGNYQAAANFTNNAIQIMMPLAAYKFRTNDTGMTIASGIPAFSVELKQFFFKYSHEDIRKYGRSPVTSDEKVNLYA